MFFSSHSRPLSDMMLYYFAFNFVITKKKGITKISLPRKSYNVISEYKIFFFVFVFKWNKTSGSPFTQKKIYKIKLKQTNGKQYVWQCKCRAKYIPLLFFSVCVLIWLSHKNSFNGFYVLIFFHVFFFSCFVLWTVLFVCLTLPTIVLRTLYTTITPCRAPPSALHNALLFTLILFCIRMQHIDKIAVCNEMTYPSYYTIGRFVLPLADPIADCQPKLFIFHFPCQIRTKNKDNNWLCTSQRETQRERIKQFSNASALLIYHCFLCVYISSHL